MSQAINQSLSKRCCKNLLHLQNIPTCIFNTGEKKHFPFVWIWGIQSSRQLKFEKYLHYPKVSSFICCFKHYLNRGDGNRYKYAYLWCFLLIFCVDFPVTAWERGVCCTNSLCQDAVRYWSLKWMKMIGFDSPLSGPEHSQTAACFAFHL